MYVKIDFSKLPLGVDFEVVSPGTDGLDPDCRRRVDDIRERVQVATGFYDKKDSWTGDPEIADAMNNHGQGQELPLRYTEADRLEMLRDMQTACVRAAARGAKRMNLTMVQAVGVLRYIDSELSLAEAKGFYDDENYVPKKPAGEMVVNSIGVITSHTGSCPVCKRDELMLSRNGGGNTVLCLHSHLVGCSMNACTGSGCQPDCVEAKKEPADTDLHTEAGFCCSSWGPHAGHTWGKCCASRCTEPYGCKSKEGV